MVKARIQKPLDPCEHALTVLIHTPGWLALALYGLVTARHTLLRRMAGAAGRTGLGAATGSAAACRTEK